LEEFLASHAYSEYPYLNETISDLHAEPKTEFTTKVSHCVNCCDVGCSQCLSYLYLSPVAADTTSHPSLVSTISSHRSSFEVISRSPPNSTHSIVSPAPFQTSQSFSLSPPNGISPGRKAITASSQRFKCSMCQQSFPTNMELRSVFNCTGRTELTVYRSHKCEHSTTSSSHTCPKCHRTFTKFKDLRRHRTYAGSCGAPKDKSHTCGVCGKNFSRPDSLRRHIQSH